MGHPAPDRISYEMGYTEIEFGNVLNGEFTGFNSDYMCTSSGTNRWCISHRSEPLTVDIAVAQASPRQLGAMSIPVLTVAFEVTAASQSLADTFFERFFQYFHKGGG